MSFFSFFLSSCPPLAAQFMLKQDASCLMCCANGRATDDHDCLECKESLREAKREFCEREESVKSWRRKEEERDAPVD